MAFPYALHLVSLRQSGIFTPPHQVQVKSGKRRLIIWQCNSELEETKITGSGLWLAWLQCLFHSQSSRVTNLLHCSPHRHQTMSHSDYCKSHIFFKPYMNVIAALKPTLFCEDRWIQWLWFLITGWTFSVSPWNSLMNLTEMPICISAKQSRTSTLILFLVLVSVVPSQLRQLTQRYRSAYLP